MRPSEKRKAIQGILGVKQDGFFGPITRTAFDLLSNEADTERTSGPDWDGTFSPTLREVYRILYETMTISSWAATRLTSIIQTAVAKRDRYATVSDLTGVPWQFIAAIHSMESSQSFTRHLHNGDPLTARTVQVPKDRPKTGTPPFSWEHSAVDALEYEWFRYQLDWTLPIMLFRLEKFNGLGFRMFHPEVNSPYLWSGSNHYLKGKYVADGRYDPEAVSKQVGAALILYALLTPN